MRVAVLGMGRMGQAVAGRLAEAGHEITIWNRTPGRAPDLVKGGAREAGSIPAAVDGAEIVITTLTNDDAVKEVALGEEGLRRSLGSGATYTDSSTVSPSTTEELDRAFDRYVAMPILGSPGQVASGGAIYLTGATGAATSALDPLFPGLSAKRLDFDRPATAAAAKLTVNLLLLDGIAALAEAFATGRAGGLSDDDLRRLLGDSPMVAPGWKNRFEGVLTGDQELLWTTVLGEKDAGLAVDLARSGGAELRLTPAARDLYADAAAADPEADIAGVGQLYRRNRPGQTGVGGPR